MTTEKILANGQEHEIETAPLTLLCHPGELHIEVPSRVEINPETTVARARQLTHAEWKDVRQNDRFLHMWKMVWGETEPPQDIQVRHQAFQHTAGLIISLAECIAGGKQPFVRTPETYLHPRQQVGLADLFAFLSKGPTK